MHVNVFQDQPKIALKLGLYETRFELPLIIKVSHCRHFVQSRDIMHIQYLCMGSTLVHYSDTRIMELLCALKANRRAPCPGTVFVQGCHSDPSPLLCGIPQGSVLGPSPLSSLSLSVSL